MDTVSTWQQITLHLRTALNALFYPLEYAVHNFLLGPIRWLLSFFDKVGEKLEGTLTRRILQVSIYPIFIVLTFIIGFALVEDGFTSRSFFGSIIMFAIYGIIFAPLERMIPFSKRWNSGDGDAAVDVILFFGRKVWGDFINRPLRLATIVILVQQISPEIGRSLWPDHLHPVLQVLLLLTVKDFFRYWYHRWMHEIPFMWRWHSVHHSSKRLYWFNGTRSHPLEGLVSSFIWAIPLALVQAPIEIIFVAHLLGRTIGRFQHTNMDLILGPLDYIFSSPKNHRYHHDKTREIGNCNYGGDIILFDHIFGTFYMPKGQTPSDDIGIGSMPNYPTTFSGIMLAPFIYNTLKKESSLDNKQSSNALETEDTKVMKEQTSV